MSTTTKYLVTCNCGHQGYIVLKENDTPYSAEFWENYKLDKLNGRKYQTKYSKSWKEIFNHLKPDCPKCGKRLEESNLNLTSNNFL